MTDLAQRRIELCERVQLDIPLEPFKLTVPWEGIRSVYPLLQEKDFRSATFMNMCYGFESDQFFSNSELAEHFKISKARMFQMRLQGIENFRNILIELWHDRFVSILTAQKAQVGAREAAIRQKMHASLMENYAVDIRSLKLSVRAKNALLNGEIFTIADLVLYDRKKLLKLPNMGVKSVDEIEELLDSMNLKLVNPEYSYP